MTPYTPQVKNIILYLSMYMTISPLIPMAPLPEEADIPGTNRHRNYQIVSRPATHGLPLLLPAWLRLLYGELLSDWSYSGLLDSGGWCAQPLIVSVEKCGLCEFGVITFDPDSSGNRRQEAQL